MRRVSAMLGTFGIVVVGVILVLFSVRPPFGASEFQALLFLAAGVISLATIPIFVVTARKTLPVLIGLEEDRILGWKSGHRDGPPQLVLRFEDVRVLADYRTQTFLLFPVPTIVSRRAEPGVKQISRLVVDGLDSPEAFTLTPDNFDRFIFGLRVWISNHPGSKIERGRFTPESLRGKLGLSDPSGFQ